MKPKNEMPQRKSPRAHWLDYNDGRYFVTVCTHGHQPFLGNIENDVMTLNEVGMYLDNELKNATLHQSNVEVLQHVVMPNHFHAIVEMDFNNVDNNSRDVACNVRENINETKKNSDAACNVPTRKGYNRSLLSTFIGSLKSAVTRYANAHNIPFAWQPRYHDHAIRDHNDYGNISEYITHNVLNWENDCFNLYKMKKMR